MPWLNSNIFSSWFSLVRERNFLIQRRFFESCYLNKLERQALVKYDRWIFSILKRQNCKLAVSLRLFEVRYSFFLICFSFLFFFTCKTDVNAWFNHLIDKIKLKIVKPRMASIRLVSSLPEYKPVEQCHSNSSLPPLSSHLALITYSLICVLISCFLPLTYCSLIVTMTMPKKDSIDNIFCSGRHFLWS